MGMYTELIFAAKLKEDTSEEVISTLRYMLGEIEISDSIAFDEGFFNCGSYYFPISEMEGKLLHDGENWVLSHRGNYKNQDNNGFIDKFLDWIRPYIASGSGQQDIFAITIAEDSKGVKTYSLE